jgi:hypothetical protein
MSRKPESLRDLIESRAAQDGIAPRQLCRWAFEAIIQNTLLLTFPKDVSPDTEWENPTDLRHAIGRLLQDFEHVDPFKFGWVGNLKCNPKEFDRWLNATKVARPSEISRLPRRKRPRKAVLHRVVQNYVNAEQSAGRATAIPRLWDYVKDELPGATYDQAVKALRDIEGGPKQRGRPRRGTSVRK